MCKCVSPKNGSHGFNYGHKKLTKDYCSPKELTRIKGASEIIVNHFWLTKNYRVLKRVHNLLQKKVDIQDSRRSNTVKLALNCGIYAYCLLVHQRCLMSIGLSRTKTAHLNHSYTQSS